jgi:hypothetical protein
MLGQHRVDDAAVALGRRVEPVGAPQVRLLQEGGRQQVADRDGDAVVVDDRDRLRRGQPAAHVRGDGAQRLHHRLDRAEVGQVPTTTIAPASRSRRTARPRSRAAARSARGG